MTKDIWTDIKTTIDLDPAAIIIKMVIILLVILATRLFMYLLTKMTTKIINDSKEIEDEEKRKSIVTSMTLVRSVGRYVIYFIAGCIIVYELGYGSILSNVVTAAGVGALVVSLGAQSIIKDVLAGMFITFERQFGVGDFVKINEYEGTVTSVAMRCTYLKTYSGQKVIIPNGQINTVVNYSESFNMAIVDVPIPYDCDIKKTVAIIKDVATAYYKDNLDICHDEPNILAINGFKDSSMTVTIHQKAKGFKHYQIQRDLMMLIKERFDEEGIQIPYSQIVVHNAD